jgi:rRNA maturation endonuclease Nob1
MKTSKLDLPPSKPRPMQATLDINRDTPAETMPPNHVRKFDCETCEHTFEVVWARDEEECPGCGELIPARAIKA